VTAHQMCAVNSGLGSFQVGFLVKFGVFGRQLVN
jgi:hypothetical protein